MNKLTTISTKSYIPLSYKDEYFYSKYEKIQSFIKNQLGEDFSNILALPIIKDGEVEWQIKSKNTFQRVSDYSKSEQDEILTIYWSKINTINQLSTTLSSSNSIDKKRWSKLIDEVFNSNNNIIFSDGKNIILLWGWKFNSKDENYNPIPIINPKPTPSIIVHEKPTPETPKISKKEPPIIPQPWYILLWEWIKRNFKRFWWLILLFLLLWYLLNLDTCSYNKARDNDFTKYNSPKNIKNKIYNNPNKNSDDWNIDNNNTGLQTDEFQQIINNNQPKELYENLLIDENGNQRLLPNRPNVTIPINRDNLIMDINKHQMIAPDRINIYLKNKNDRIKDFAVKFKEKFPNSDYQIIYRDENMRRIQIRVPEIKREEIKIKIKNDFNEFNLLIWDETIFQQGTFTDPGLRDKDINYYFKNINMFEAWEKTSGSKDIIIAIIDDGFDLDHDELNDNIIKPYNVLNHNDIVYANNNLNHGTHVAGLAIAEKNNNFGVCGIAPDCSFMPIQIGSESYPGSFAMSDIIDGVIYAINNGADIINLSLQAAYTEEAKDITDKQLNEILNNVSRDDEFFWKELFKIANDSNITIVLAAGNYEVLIGLDAMKRDNNIITVSAVDNKNKKAKFSNYGKRSTISAPGVNIFSCKPGGQFVSMDGTSMSSPIISGVIGLMKSIQPELSNKEIIEILQKSGKNIDTDIGPLVQVDKVLSLCINEQFISEKKLNTDSIKNEIKELQIRIQELKELL